MARPDREGLRARAETHESSFANMSNMSAFHAMALGSIYFSAILEWRIIGGEEEESPWRGWCFEEQALDPGGWRGDGK